MRQLVSVSSGFRVAKVTAFRLGMAICVRSAEPGLRHEIKISATTSRSRYGCTADFGMLVS